MAKGLGIGALVLAVIAIFIPVIGVFLAWVALALATFSALSGEKVFSITTTVISAVNLAILSPSLWIATVGTNMNAGLGSPNAALMFSVVMAITPVVALVFRSTGKVVLRLNESPPK